MKLPSVDAAERGAIVPGMAKSSTRYMSFNLRLVETEGGGEVWHWLVYDDPNEHFLRNGHTTGSRRDAELAARVAIASMGGVVREIKEDNA